MRKTKKELIINIVLFIVVSFICFFILEFGVRLFFGPGRIQDSNGNTPYIEDDELGYKMKPDFSGYLKEIDFNTEFNTNSQGFRSDFDFSEDDKNIIFMLGDSFTAGSGVEQDDNIASQLQSILSDYKVYNFGVSGYSQREQATQLQRMLPIYNPKLIILNFYAGNDVSDNCDNLQNIKNGKSLYEKLKYTIKGSQLIVLIYRKLIVPFKYPHNLDYYIDSPEIQECYETTKQHLIKIKGLSSKYKVKLLMTIIAREAQTVKEKKEDLIGWYDNFESYDPVKFDLDIVNKKILKMCDELDISCLDLTPVFIEKDGKLILYVKDSHWNKEGHKLASQAIAKYLNVNGYLN